MRSIFKHWQTRSFPSARIGNEVIFLEEAGDDGPQAITIRPAGKHHSMERRKNEPSPLI